MKSYPVTKLPPTKYMGNVVFRLPKAIECCNSIASISASMKSNVEHSAADGAKPRRGRRRSDKPALAAVATTSLSPAADAEPSDADTVTESSESTSAPTRGSGGLPPARPLGELLLERKLVTTEQLTQAMDRQKRTRQRLGRVLVEMGFATAEGVLDALSAQLGVNSTRVNSYTVNPEAVQCLPERVARKHMAFPLLKVGSTLVVAIASPKNLHALDDLRFASGCGVQTMVALETEIQAGLDKYYGNTFAGAEADDTGAVVIDKNSLRVRLRIDGTFHEVAHLLPALAPAVIARLKVLSGMDIAEHRLPQDGRFSATVGGHGLDMRTSTYPTIWGEKAVLRLLDRTRLQLSLDGIMTGRSLEGFRELIRKPEGIILVTGPTGSGKTSSLYASLAEQAEMGKNIITIEDPVEYWLPGGRPQLVDATKRLNTSDGFIHPNVARGRLLSWRATAFNSVRV